MHASSPDLQGTPACCIEDSLSSHQAFSCDQLRDKKRSRAWLSVLVLAKSRRVVSLEAQSGLL